MEENTTSPVHVTGEKRPHPAVRRLARACIALVLWQRKQQNQPPQPPNGEQAVHDATGPDGSHLKTEEPADHD